MPSVKKLVEMGVMKTTDAEWVRPDQLHTRPGFNAPESEEAFRARVDGFKEFIRGGGIIPPVIMMDRDEGGFWKVDGHARQQAVIELAEEGSDKVIHKDGRAWILTMRHRGTLAQALGLTIKTTKGRRLDAFQTAAQYQKMIDEGMTAEEIGRDQDVDPGQVRNMLTFGSAPPPVQEQVREGKISTTDAVKVIRQHGHEKAEKVIEEALTVAKSMGKSKVTASVLNKDKKEAARSQTDQLQEDADLLRWLIENCTIQHCTEDGIIDLRIRADVSDYTNLRDALLQAKRKG